MNKSIFQKIEDGQIDLSTTGNNKNLIMAYLKTAFNEGVEAGKAETRERLKDVYKAIDTFFEDGNYDN